MLNTFYLRTFLAVVEAGTYTDAARTLHLSQPAVSQQIRTLEEQLGNTRLFRRERKRMVLTHAGEELLPIARELVGLAERAEQNILALRGQVSGRVALGCTPSSGEQLLPRLLSIFHQQYPAITLALELNSAEALLDALAERELGMLILEEQQRRRGIESYLLGSEGLALIAPNGHALLQQDDVPPGTLREHNLALPSAGAPLRRTIEDGLRRRGVPFGELRIVFEANSITALLTAVRTGLGIAFVPKSCLSGRLDGIGCIDLAGQSLQQDWYLLRARERNMPRAAQTLYDFLSSTQGRAHLQHMGVHQHVLP
jgi:DNA-binding transcriptional LysR family regulator